MISTPHFNPYRPMAAALCALLLAAVGTPLGAAPADTGQRDAHHQKHHGYGHHRSTPSLHAEHWRSTLTAEQKSQLDGLDVAFVKNTTALQLRMRALKAELAELVVGGGFDMRQVEAKVDDYLLLKREKMLLKYKYKSEVRAQLTPEQQLSFDMETMLKARRGHRGGHHRGR